MKKRLINNLDSFKLILVISLFVMSLSIMVEQIYKKNHFEVQKTQYKFYIKDENGVYQPHEGNTLPGEGYTLNVEKTNEECTRGTISQNDDLSIQVLTNYAMVCNLFYDPKPDSQASLEKLQELSGRWQVNENTPDFSTVSPRAYTTYTDNNFPGSETTNSSARNMYFTCSSYYTMDTTTGKYSLTGTIKVIRLNSSSNATSLESCKYIVSSSGSSSSSQATYTNLNTIYMVTDASYTSSLFTSTGTVKYKASSNTPVTNADCTDCDIYHAEDDYGDSYYIRGKYDNVYVKFANKFWKIVRINGDGSLRMIYDGATADSNENAGTGAFNSATNDNAYLGYMYGTPGSTTFDTTHANTTASTIKGSLETWYQNNLSSEASYISDTLFCYDRSLSSGNGYGTNTTYYGSYNRLNDNKSPVLICERNEDKFTVSDTDNGNGKNSSPIGLLTRDEAAMAGFVNGQNNIVNYLYKGYAYWLGTPHSFDNSKAYIGIINADGKINGGSVNSLNYAFVPVINLTPQAVQKFTGTGTASYPFKITEGPLSIEDNYSDSSLYGVIANEYKNRGLAGKYTGEHADAYDRSGTKNIYYFTTPTSNSEIEGNRLLDKWNVIFGGFCWQMLRTTDTGGIKMIYNGTPTNGTCNNSGTDQQIGKSAFNSNYKSPAYVGYMYNTIYETNHENAGAYKYGNSFTYSNGTYTLSNTITTSSSATESDLNNHHYTCFNTSGTCSSISYIFNFGPTATMPGYVNYISIENGKSISDALQEMLYDTNVNSTNSTVKTYIDNWYQNRLSRYASYLEDTVFCNDRSISQLGGWNANGGSVKKTIWFKEHDATNDLSCTNETDRFSTLNNMAKLSYPIGLSSSSEMNLINNRTSRDTGEAYMLISAAYFGTSASEKLVYDGGGLTTTFGVEHVSGVRPVISLKPGTEYTSGNGSKNNPYIVNTSS